MPVATRRELLEAGVHFGHQTRRWNPKMRRFIFGERSGIYIIDLEKTLSSLQQTYEFLVDIGRRNGSILFVGTKKQAQETVQEQAQRVGMPFVNTRWLGGMLTNFQTIHARLKRMRELREMERSGAFEYLPKKEVLKLRHEKEKLERNLAGIQDMDRLPDAVYVIDTKREAIAVKEARKLGIPVVAIVDTNCDPDEVDFVVPGNDDAIRSCSLITKVVADALQEGQYLAYRGMQARATGPEFEQEPAAPTFEPEVEPEPRREIQLSEEEAAFFGAELEPPARAEGEAPEAGVEGATAPADADAAQPAGTEAETVAEPVVPERQAAAAEPTAAEEPAATAEPVGAEEPEQGLDAAASSDTSATWAAPKDPSDLESSMVPSEVGTADALQLEHDLDRAPGEPADDADGSPMPSTDATSAEPSTDEAAEPSTDEAAEPSTDAASGPPTGDETAGPGDVTSAAGDERTQPPDGDRASSADDEHEEPATNRARTGGSE